MDYDDMQTDVMELPLFPLNVVLFPGQTLPLHIFEQRYRIMVERCIENQEPFGVVLAAFLMGALDAGASRMQFDSGVAADIIQIIQALVLVFVAAPIIIRSIFRLPEPKDTVDATPLRTVHLGGIHRICGKAGEDGNISV